MSIIDGGFRRVKYKVACDDDLRFRGNQIKTNEFQPSELTLSAHPQSAALSLLTTILRKTETDAEHYRTAIGHSAFKQVLNNFISLSKILSYQDTLLRNCKREINQLLSEFRTGNIRFQQVYFYVIFFGVNRRGLKMGPHFTSPNFMAM